MGKIGIRRCISINYASKAIWWSSRNISQAWDCIKLLSAAFFFKTRIWNCFSWKQRMDNATALFPILSQQLALWSSSLLWPWQQPGSRTHRVEVPETTYSSRWPLLSGPLVQPHHWRHCTHSPPTAPAWCPGFPGIRLHSQSPRLQEKVWWEEKQNTKGINLENKV